MRIKRVAALIAAVAFVAIAASASPYLFDTASAQEKKAEEAKLTASQKQGVVRLRAACWMGRGVREFLWSEFDPNSIPVLMVERRSGRAPWALLINHPKPPQAFAPAAPADETGAAVLLAAGAVSLPGETSPISIGDVATAVFFVGETIPDDRLGSEASERIVARILHEMIHVWAVRQGLSAGLVPAHPAAFPDSPEIVALAAVEGRILADFLYADTGKAYYLQDLARQFVAVRRARWTLMGPASDYERRVELWESPAVFVESQVFKWGGQRFVEQPPDTGLDPAYHSFNYGLLWRLSFLIDRLLKVPVGPECLPPRLAWSGGAQLLLLDRLGYDWRPDIFKEGTTLPDLIAQKVPVDGAAMSPSETLTAARKAFGYEAALAIARERMGPVQAR